MHLLVGSLSLVLALIGNCQLPQIPRSWQHCLPGSLLLHKVNQSSGESWQHPGTHVLSWEGVVSPFSQAFLQVRSLESSARLSGWTGHRTPGPQVKQTAGWHFGSGVCWRARHEKAACLWAPIRISIKFWGHAGLESDGSGTIAQCQLMGKLKLTSN